MSLNESIVEDAALTWFGGLGYAVGHGPQLAPGEYAGGPPPPALSQGERESYGEVLLVDRLREGIRRLNPAVPEEAPACATHADRRATGKRDLQVRFERSNP
jgi:type I restriction enzyme R subunit